MWKLVAATSTISLGGLGYYRYKHDHTFRSICNLTYSGIQMAYIYKYTSDSIQVKNIKASTYLHDALRSNGGIYLKLGQLIATLDVIVPDQYREVMSRLTRQCTQSSYQQVKKTVEEDLNFPIEVVFKEFDKKPKFSASIGQVHRARLLNGEEVAVKVQHGRLKDQVEADLKMMRTFSNMAKRLFEGFNYQWLVEGFQKNIRLQLDFRKEAANISRTRQFLIENKFNKIYVPKVFLKPTQRLLILQYIDGVHIDEMEKLKAMKINVKQMGRQFSRMIIKMIHKEGFVHADPHSGNLMVRKFKGKDQLVILDHGLYQQLDLSLKRSYNQFWYGLIVNNPKYYEQAALKLGTTSPNILRSILTSKSTEELDDHSRKHFDLNPSKDRAKILAEASKNHQQIVKVLSELKRQVLLLLKVNQFARTIQNMAGGRQLGVYEDIAKECIQNLGFPWPRRMYEYGKLMFI